MPTIKQSYCDQCNKQIDLNDNNTFLIYSISFWSNIKYNEENIDFLRKNGEALMFCSGICMGNYLETLMTKKEY